MIPKPLNEIEWADIEALRDSGREEDDTIEYKRCFSGGSDFLAFTEGQRRKALEGVASEAIAFLNARGGDVVIGVQEASNDHPRIDLITPVENAIATADRLAQSLAALIEPAQSVLTVRAITRPNSSGKGVIVIRAPASLRAPHRLTINRDCYIRRGRECVPMPMDEVHDVTLRRADLRLERQKLLDTQFADFGGDSVGRQKLSAHRFHIRVCYVPEIEQSIFIDENCKIRLRGQDPTLNRGGKLEKIEVPFRNIGINWKPILRGYLLENVSLRKDKFNDFIYIAKYIKNNGVIASDLGVRVKIDGDEKLNGFYFYWLAGFAANVIVSFSKILDLFPQLSPGVLRVAFYSAGEINVQVGDRFFGQLHSWPTGVISLPDFEIRQKPDLEAAFMQMQDDWSSILGFEDASPFTFVDSI